MSGPGLSCWCQAQYCSRQVCPGQVFCAPHLERLDGCMRRDLSRIDPRPLLAGRAPANLDTLGRLELVARAVEALALAERQPVANPWRRWATQMARRLERAESEPDPPIPAEAEREGGGGPWG